MKNLLIILFILVVATATDATAQSFKVIVNEANATETISQSELADIFLKKKTKWEDGTAIVPVDLSANSATRKIFSRQVLNKGVGEIRTYWQQAAFSGSGTAPLERASDSDVVSFVKANPGAVGYVSASTDVTGVKTLDVN